MIKNCNQCGNEYNARPRSKVCSRKCSHASQCKKVEKICPVCSNPFLVKLEVLAKNKGICCSKRCDTEKRKGIGRNFVCLGCGKISNCWKSKSTRKFCSQKCREDLIKSRSRDGKATCRLCNTEKLLEEFTPSRTSLSGYEGRCRDCNNKRRKLKYYEENYNLSKNDVAQMAANQNHLCLICQKKPTKLFVDHCHTSGKVRGLLCGKCNSGIGLFKENTESLSRAIDYLEKHSTVDAPDSASLTFAAAA